MSGLPSRVVIAARKSDLARLQARVAGQALKDRYPGLRVEFHFRESLGDKNLSDPLWKMPERGVFTEDFAVDLKAGAFDMVVHSWKDLPTEERPDSLIAATLPRADMRDLLLVRRDRWEAAKARGKLVLFSSSPRREHNLRAFLPEALPGGIRDFDFQSVRGNIPTRLRKLLAADSPADALVLAKAAVDRLLAAPDKLLGDDFSDARAAILDAFSRCRWMVLPLRENPTAAAQGALAFEILRSRSDLAELLAGVHCARTFEAVSRERAVLSTYGGGCHQKIGVSCFGAATARAISLRGLTTAGETLDCWALERAAPVAKSPAAECWPLHPEKSPFDREGVEAAAPVAKAWWVAKALALPQSWSVPEETVLWAAGSSTWRELARRGFWVNGSAEGLGESRPALPWCEPDWIKLTHADAPEEGVKRLSTYRLKPRAHDAWPDLSAKRSFFWSSGSLFEAALKLFPSIRDARHACGPGHTAARIRELLGREPELYLGWEEWRRESVADPA